MTRRDRRQLRRERRRRRFDPLQRANDFTMEPSPRTETLSIERRVNLLSNLAKNAMLLAGKPLGRQLLETVLELPEPSELDIGRLIILRSGPGLADRMYIGMQLDDDSVAWVEMTTEQAGLQRGFVRNINLASSPDMLAVDNNGNVFISRGTAHTIEYYTSGGVHLKTWGTGSSSTIPDSGADTNNLNTPVGLAWAASTLNWVYPVLYIAQQGRHIVNSWSTHVINPFSGSYSSPSGGAIYAQMAQQNRAGTNGTSGSSNSHLNLPQGVAVDAFGDVYIADFNNDRVQRFRPRVINTLTPPSYFYVVEYQYLQTFGSSSNLDGPVGVAVDSALNVYVSEFYGDRITKFDGGSGYVTSFGTGPGTGDGELTEPRQIAFDPSGYLHVCDGGNDRIQVFDTSGTFVTKYGATGSGDGQFDAPTGIAIASNGTIFIADYNNDRVQVWV